MDGYEIRLLRGLGLEDEAGEEDLGLTSIVPRPHFAVHEPPLKLIQLRWPQGPSPTRIIGLSWQDMRKSRSRVGVGRVRDGEGQSWGGEDFESVVIVGISLRCNVVVYVPFFKL